jgi:hypothetical protein
VYYSASSPDEQALVAGAKHFGFLYEDQVTMVRQPLLSDIFYTSPTLLSVINIVYFRLIKKKKKIRTAKQGE